MTMEEKINRIIQDLQFIKTHLNIVPDRDITINDYDSSLESYEHFAREELNLEPLTIENQKSAIRRFLDYSNGVINQQTVRSYLDSNDSSSWKSNQIKALRKYLRDYLKLGNWIEDFKFSKTKTRLKEIPSDEIIVKLLQLLPQQTQVIALFLLTSGLRLGEVLSLRFINIANGLNMVDATQIHKGSTKHSWISFVSQQTTEILYDYLNEISFDFGDDSKLFSYSSRLVQNHFEKASEQIGAKLNPHMLRTVFTEKCTISGIKDKYIDAFCGRTPKSVLAKNYTDYSPSSLKREYEKVEALLTFEG